ncbi:helix-turn-helix domain-containing protein [Pantoea brenneri]|nr:helix-turn-helix transcriptional regulator [Pantoea brenneri]MDH1088815.1 helix-turn-helix domain-containing protein [Pantoea brenneri]
MREHANINKAELARRLNITPSTITQLEHNPGRVKLSTLEWYAAACGGTINISVTYSKPAV